MKASKQVSEYLLHRFSRESGFPLSRWYGLYACSRTDRIPLKSMEATRKFFLFVVRKSKWIPARLLWALSSFTSGTCFDCKSIDLVSKRDLAEHVKWRCSNCLFNLNTGTFLQNWLLPLFPRIYLPHFRRSFFQIPTSPRLMMYFQHSKTFPTVCYLVFYISQSLLFASATKYDNFFRCCFFQENTKLFSKTFNSAPLSQMTFSWTK